jgi:hypothetical protein
LQIDHGNQALTQALKPFFERLRTPGLKAGYGSVIYGTAEQAAEKLADWAGKTYLRDLRGLKPVIFTIVYGTTKVVP